MSASDPFRLRRPCALCPFRTDVIPYLTRARVESLDVALEQKTFTCHETLVRDGEGELAHAKDSAHCAGALILLEKLKRPSQAMRIAERFKLYDRTKLDMGAPVYASFRAMARAQTREGRLAKAPRKKTTPASR